jgi:hypothetical protein
MSTTFTHVSYLFFIEDKDIQVDQPIINLSGYIQQISQIPIHQQFPEEFYYGKEFFKHLLQYFKYPKWKRPTDYTKRNFSLRNYQIKIKEDAHSVVTSED